MHLIARRALLTAAAAVPLVPRLPAVASVNPVRDGMAAFSAGNVERSIALFDEAILAKPAARPYLWQRGLSLYYADRFADGAEQFATDVSVNPNDTEEAIWNFLCVARSKGFEEARKNMLRVGVDRRPVMRAALQLFQGETDEGPLQAFAASDSASDTFYANLYLGLFREAKADTAGARKFITTAAGSRYGRLSGDYMADLAKVHVAQRGW